MARSRKSRKKGKKSPWVEIESEVATSVFGVIMLALSLVVALAHFGVTQGWFATLIARGLAFLFGSGAFLFPVILFAASVYIVLSHKPRVIASAILGSAMVLVSSLGLVEIIGSNGLHVGGWVGFVTSWPFLKSLGFWGSFVILLAIFISGILITFRIPLKSRMREAFYPDEDEDEEEEPEEKGLLRSMADAAKSVIPSVPSLAEREMVVNKPGSVKVLGGKTKTGIDNVGLDIIPLSKDYTFPPLDLLEDESGSPVSGDIKANALIIEKTLEHFGIPVEMAEVNVGPSITQFTLKPATGVKLSKLISLQNDLALALAAHPLRIEAPIPGKSLVGIEIPNKKTMTVRLRGLLEGFDGQEQTSPLNLALGRDVAGLSYWSTLTRMPHLLVAGATGTGKSVAINAMLLTLLFQHSPEILRLILIDPKRVELTPYNGIPHLLTPVITQPKKAVSALRWAVAEMERRYEVLSEEKVRDIQGYNAKEKSKKDGEFMPYLVIVIDELADLMASYGRDIEGSIVRLAQMARAVGIHLVVSTQRPSVEVITGLIKANISSRVAFQVVSQIDSRTILDTSGAEKLLGNGDMLFVGNDFTRPRRFQGTFVTEKEVKRVVAFLRKNAKFVEDEDEESDLDGALGGKSSSIDLDNFEDEEYEDDLYPDARELVIEAKKASASLLQRRLRVGYARAARLLDMLEDNQIVGPADGAKPREVYIDDEPGAGTESEEF